MNDFTVFRYGNVQSYFFANKNTVYNFSCKKKNNTAYQAFQSAYAKFHLARPENCR